MVRGLYVNRFAAQSRRKMAKLLAIADSTDVNAFVVDMKDEFGLNYRSADSSLARNAGTTGKLRDVRELLDTLRAHDILPIARLVTFKDSVAARMNPDDVIRQPNGMPWHDKQGLTWVNPYSPRIREYNLKVAEELVRLGFREIQWDYIRFPEPYQSLPPQRFPGSGDVTKPKALADFLGQAQRRLHALGVRNTADIFGLVTTVQGPLEVGQRWEDLAPVTDVLLPMVYPSHYPPGSFGIARPNAAPYEVVKRAITRAKARNAALGLSGQHVRPWLQAFSLGKPDYGAAEVRAQMQAVYDAGYQGWVLWHPGLDVRAGAGVVAVADPRSRVRRAGGGGGGGVGTRAPGPRPSQPEAKGRQGRIRSRCSGARRQCRPSGSYRARLKVRGRQARRTSGSQVQASGIRGQPPVPRGLRGAFSAAPWVVPGPSEA